MTEVDVDERGARTVACRGVGFDDAAVDLDVDRTIASASGGMSGIGLAGAAPDSAGAVSRLSGNEIVRRDRSPPVFASANCICGAVAPVGSPPSADAGRPFALPSDN